MFGDFAQARPILEERLALLKDIGDRVAIADAVYWLGNVALHLGDDQRAKAMYEESLAVARELGARQMANAIQSELAHL